MKYLIRSDKFGWLWDFDGEDYRWTKDRSLAWTMRKIDVTLHFARLSAYVDDAEIWEAR